MKIAIKRGSRSSAGSAVLEPEESFVPKTEHENHAASEEETRRSWFGRGPAPAGALQRGYGIDGEPSEFTTAAPIEEAPYIPRRGGFQWRLRALPRSLGGRIVMGCVVFGALGAVAVAVAGVRYFLLHDDRFLMTTSADIQIQGNEHLTRGQILNVFAGDLERNLFKVSLAERRADLERLPWVEHATVMRLLPNQVRVAITERTPVAFVRQGSQIGLVDAGGVLLDMPPEAAGDPKYSFPVLTGLAASDPLAARAARMEIYRRFMKELDSSNEHLTNSLSEVDVSNPEDVKALVTGGGSDILVHFGDEQFLERYKQFEQHLAEWKAQYPKLASADMRYEGQIVLEMQQGAGVPLNEAQATTNTMDGKVDAMDAKAGVKESKTNIAIAKTPEIRKAKIKPSAKKKSAPVVKARAIPKPAVGVSQ